MKCDPQTTKTPKIDAAVERRCDEIYFYWRCWSEKTKARKRQSVRESLLQRWAENNIDLIEGNKRAFP